MRRILLACASMSLWAGAASAGDLVYTPVNPSFGGNPLNSAHLLGLANAQRDATAEGVNDGPDPLLGGGLGGTGAGGTGAQSDADLFVRQLQGRLLSALAGQVTEAIFGENPQDNGTVQFGSHHRHLRAHARRDPPRDRRRRRRHDDRDRRAAARDELSGPMTNRPAAPLARNPFTRNPFTRKLRTLLALGALGLTAACSTLPSSPLGPVVPPVTPTSSELRELPPPTEKVAVAVYDFPDLTGQYKERENVQSLSRAVTQGAATMLIKSLQEAGERRWFTVLERTDFDDLLRERQIITEMRRLYQGEEQINPNAVPPLLHAGIILQGGIIGYDTNTVTGGAGLRVLATGGDGKYQQDTVTVNLRAISTKTGEVLLNVTARKSVLSTALQGGTFRYLQVDKILEAEAGITSNEPRQIAVQAAIDEAVRAMIVEGADLDLWDFQDRAGGGGADRRLQDAPVPAPRGARRRAQPALAGDPRPVRHPADQRLAAAPHHLRHAPRDHAADRAAGRAQPVAAQPAGAPRVVGPRGTVRPSRRRRPAPPRSARRRPHRLPPTCRRRRRPTSRPSARPIRRRPILPCGRPRPILPCGCRCRAHANRRRSLIAAARPVAASVSNPVLTSAAVHAGAGLVPATVGSAGTLDPTRSGPPVGRSGPARPALARAQPARRIRPHGRRHGRRRLRAAAFSAP